MEQAELARLYHQYGYLVRRRCRALLGSDAEADDAVQEVFLRVHRHGAPRDAQATLGWLYAIASNVAFDRKRPKRDVVSASGDLASLDARAHGSAEEADVRAVVSGVLREMDERTRQMVVRHHLDGLTQDEVASELGMSRRVVGRGLSAFADRLRQAWSGKRTSES